MREKLLLSGIAIIASCTFISCAYEEVLNHTPPTPPEIKSEVKFSSNILTSGSYSLRMIGDFWEPGDAIGTYMIEKVSYVVAEGKENVRYMTDKGGYTGNFYASGNYIYFPDDGRDVRFMSYYPYNESVKGAIYKLDVSTQFPQSKLDFLYSFNTSATYNKNIETEKIPIIFKNQMAKILINVKNGGSLQGYDLMYMKVYFSGLSTKADFDLLTGKTINYSGTSPIYPSVLIAGKGNVYSAEAIVIPTSDLSNAKIVFDLNNGHGNKKSDVYTWNFDKGLEKGKRYTYNVIISNTGISVSTTIHNWNSIYQEETTSFE